MTVNYIDIASYQAGIDLTGQQHVCVKATQGGDTAGDRYVNPDYARVAAFTKSSGAALEAYHYIVPSSQAGMDAEADYALSIIGAGVATMIDAEKSGLSLTDILWFEEEYRARGGSTKSVYLPRWYWQAIGSPNLTEIFTAGIHLVSSAYPSNGYTTNGEGWTSYGGVTPTFWQWTSTYNFTAHNGKSWKVDCNAFEGTPEQLTEIWYPQVTESLVPYPGHNIAENSTDHANVRLIQKALNAHGAKLSEDGSFGPLTLAAVELFQRAHIATVKWIDGVVGPLTWSALGVTS